MEDSQGSETALCDTVTGGSGHYAFVQTHGKCTIRSDSNTNHGLQLMIFYPHGLIGRKSIPQQRKVRTAAQTVPGRGVHGAHCTSCTFCSIFP